MSDTAGFERAGNMPGAVPALKATLVPLAATAAVGCGAPNSKLERTAPVEALVAPRAPEPPMKPRCDAVVFADEVVVGTAAGAAAAAPPPPLNKWSMEMDFLAL